jgi:hypothetical protein
MIALDFLCWRISRVTSSTSCSVSNRIREYVDSPFRNASVNENIPVVISFTKVADAHRGQLIRGASRLADPHLTRVAHLKDLGGFFGAVR